jgi:ribosomal protein RSM22 (predicted rRNA methylase)
VDLPNDLSDALDGVCAEIPLREITASVDRLITRYRAGGRADRPILASAVDVAAYAAYRMPATSGAVHSALGQFAVSAPEFRPSTLVDVGGGTGAAAWAATEVFPTLTTVTVFDQVAEALDLGRRLAGRAESAAMRAAEWRRMRFEEKPEFPRADLVTVSYVLSELSDRDQAALVSGAAAGAEAVAVIEPGTPDGHARILAARDALLALGMTVAAPCPHQGECPIARGPDWCHFTTRISRSALHRRLKSAELGYEDEKFSFVVASKTPTPTAPGRVLRHPRQRKGLVAMQVCTSGDGMVQTLVSKRQGDLYRAARDAEWGDPWPPLSPETDA